MDNNWLQRNLKNPQSRLDIIKEHCVDKEVLDIGCIHHDVTNTENASWLHKTIAEISSDVLGVDYLEDEVNLLTGRGYKIVAADVNKPLQIERKFDVIVVGNIIEHLSNFEGLLNNVRNLMKPDGVVLISTANPFFREQYFFSAFKNDIIVNPEHTCWIDPVTLDQLCQRFDLITQDVRWVKEAWTLSKTIFHGERQSLDTFTGRWTFNSPPTLLEKTISTCLELAFRIPIQPERQTRVKKRYNKDLGRFLYLRFKGMFVDAWWNIRRLVIPTSDINRYELYVSILKFKDCNKKIN